MVLGKGAHCLRPPSPSRTRRAWRRDGPSRAGGVYFHSSPTRILSSIAARAAQRERLLVEGRLTRGEERPFLAEHLEDGSVPSSCKGRNVSSSKDASLEEEGGSASSSKEGRMPSSKDTLLEERNTPSSQDII